MRSVLWGACRRDYAGKQSHGRFSNPPPQKDMHARKAALIGSCSHLAATPFHWSNKYGLVVGLLLAFVPGAAWASCTQTGNTVTCTPATPQTTRVGNGDPSDNITVNVQDNAQITVSNDSAISLGDNANITLGANSRVTNNATSSGGLWNAGRNTIEFGSNGRLTVGAGAVVTANGTQNNGEPVNVIVKRRSKGTPDRRRRGTPFSDNMMLVC